MSASEIVVVLGPAGMEREAIKKSVELTGEFKAVCATSMPELSRRAASPPVILCVLQMFAAAPGKAARADRADARAGPPAPLLLVETADVPDSWLVEGLRGGAVAVIAWPCLANELRVALHAARQGAAHLTPRAGGLLVGGIRKDPPRRLWELKLTPRERQLAHLLRAGGTNQGIANQLGVAESTVECHLTHIFRKLGVQSRAEAAVQLQPNAAGMPEGLTTVEQRVVVEILQGRGNDDVADRLELSRHTVEAHLTRAYQKLGVRNRLELIAKAAGNVQRDLAMARSRLKQY